MEYLVPGILTLLTFCSIIVILKKVEKKVLKIDRYRQSDIHQIVKPVLHDSVKTTNKKTQLDKMLEKNSINVMVIDEQAYWVVENVFYTAKFVDGVLDPETTKPIDTTYLSKADIDKMFFILDNLGDGKTNDSGGSR